MATIDRNDGNRMFPTQPFPRPMVLIGGCPRSGTTPLMMLLNSDPRVFVSNEENVPQLISRLEPLLGTRERRAGKTGGKMRDTSVRETASLAGFDAANFTCEALPAVLGEIYRCHHRARHSGAELALAGDKYPRYYETAEEIFALPFPVRYIQITATRSTW